ncbi:MAG: hypothetical protein ACRD1R_21415, partial [Acidobacteriota bacterium]
TAQDSHLQDPLRKVSALAATRYIASPSPRLRLAHKVVGTYFGSPRLNPLLWPSSPLRRS